MTKCPSSLTSSTHSLKKEVLSFFFIFFFFPPRRTIIPPVGPRRPPLPPPTNQLQRTRNAAPIAAVPWEEPIILSRNWFSVIKWSMDRLFSQMSSRTGGFSITTTQERAGRNETIETSARLRGEGKRAEKEFYDKIILNVKNQDSE